MATTTYYVSVIEETLLTYKVEAETPAQALQMAEDEEEFADEETLGREMEAACVETEEQYRARTASGSFRGAPIKQLTGRTMKPAYAHNDSDYTPWHVAHYDSDKLSDEELTAQFNKWRRSKEYDPASDTPATDYARWLQSQGYIIPLSTGEPHHYEIPLLHD